MAPAGMHVIHAYCAGSEPYEVWENESKESYEALKKVRAEPIWEAIQRRAPAVVRGAEGVVVEQTATPVTLERFLRRHRGNYGLAIPAGGDPRRWRPGVSRCH